jgi:hypothetical protein
MAAFQRFLPSLLNASGRHSPREDSNLIEDIVSNEAILFPENSPEAWNFTVVQSLAILTECQATKPLLAGI